MSTEQFSALLVFLGAVIAAVVYVIDRSGKRLADSIPPDVLTLMLGLLDLADRLADTTPTPDDDALIARLREALGKPTQPPADGAAPQTADELAARLDGAGAQG